MSNSKQLTPSRLVSGVHAFLDAVVCHLEDPTIGVQALRLLTALHVHGTLNQTQLPKMLGVEKAAVSRNISKLSAGAFVIRGSGERVFVEGAGLIETYEEPTDRRFKLVRLTDKGREVLEGAAAHACPMFGGT